jgi:sugar phosphate isomerase/epimerase
VKLAVSNIALPAYDHVALLPRVGALGLEGLEVALSRVWRDDANDPPAAAVARYRRAVEAAGLAVVGLHALFWQVPELGLFRGAAARGATLDFLARLSRICADLGGRTLIYGSAPARQRGDLPVARANAEAIEFFAELARRIAGDGTCLCIEPLGTVDSDYVNSVREALALVEAVGHPAFRTHLDAKALVQAGEVDEATFACARATAAHFHANEPDLGVLGSTGAVDHARLGALLRGIGYAGFASIEQRMTEGDPLAGIARSAAVLRRAYGDARAPASA